MQDVDRPADVQRFAEPPWERRPRVQMKPVRLVPRAKVSNTIAGHLGWRRDVGEYSAIRATEAKLAIGQPIGLVAPLVDSPVMTATEQGEIREGGGTALGPVTKVMALAEPPSAAREAATTVSMVERSA